MIKYTLTFKICLTVLLMTADWLYGRTHQPNVNKLAITDDNEKNFSEQKPPEVSDYFKHQKNYVPGKPLNSTVKTIYLAIHIWQKDDGTGNFSESDFIYERMYELIGWVNHILAVVRAPVRPVPGVEYLDDSHIRLELKGVLFHRNSELYQVGCHDGLKLNRAVYEDYPDFRRFLNLHFTKGSCRGASGYANYPSASQLENDSFVVSFIKDWEDETTYPFWGFQMHLIHELGHNLDLRHPYNSEYCSFSHPDFLFDLFGFEQQEWCENPRGNCDICYHQGGWGCDFEDPETTCTNNIMGGNRSSRSITPLQMGRMNRALALKNVRKYAWGYSPEPFVVDSCQLWSFNKKFYQDIRVSEGSTLYITGALEMVPQASIILEPEARLVIDGGRISNALYSDFFWQGVVIEEPASRRGFWRRKPKPGQIILINGGILDNHL